MSRDTIYAFPIDTPAFSRGYLDYEIPDFRAVIRLCGSDGSLRFRHGDTGDGTAETKTSAGISFEGHGTAGRFGSTSYGSKRAVEDIIHSMCFSGITDGQACFIAVFGQTKLVNISGTAIRTVFSFGIAGRGTRAFP